jgi:hypothetical protein
MSITIREIEETQRKLEVLYLRAKAGNACMEETLRASKELDLLLLERQDFQRV